jgi:hypothetical protein
MSATNTRQEREQLVATFVLAGFEPGSKVKNVQPLVKAVAWRQQDRRILLVNNQGIAIITKPLTEWYADMVADGGRREPRDWSSFTLAQLRLMHARLLRWQAAESAKAKEAAREQHA